MAKKIVKEKAIEETLWQSCDKLRGSVEPAEYKHVVLGLIFLKFASDKFEHRKKELIAEGKDKYVEMKDFYAMKNVFYLDEISRWSYIIKNAKQNDISLKIDTALNTIEKNNPALKGALPDNYFSRIGLDKSKLASLLDTINEIDTLKDNGQDIVGRVYEYFLAKFALKEGKGKGEFYTPKSIVNLIAEMIEPYKGIIYDPACGSGGMFVQSIKFIEAHHGSKKEISIYGQEYTNTTYKLAKMNLAIRGISGNMGGKAADTFHQDQHKDLKANFIMANPPFNQKAWRAENELLDDPRWMGYEVPPKSNANYGWILNKNKKQRTETTNDKQKNYRDRTGEILFMDLRRWGSEYEKKFIELTEDDIQKVALNYHNWQSSTSSDSQNKYKDIPEYCKSAGFEDLKANNFSLVPSKYIEFVDKDSGIDFDSEMKRIQQDFKILLQEEKTSQNQLLNAFKTLGYSLEP